MAEEKIECGAQQIRAPAYPEDGTGVRRGQSEAHPGKDPGAIPCQNALRQQADKDGIGEVQRHICGMVTRRPGLPQCVFEHVGEYEDRAVVHILRTKHRSDRRVSSRFDQAVIVGQEEQRYCRAKSDCRHSHCG